MMRGLAEGTEVGGQAKQGGAETLDSNHRYVVMT
jgi:hypothetical protein